MSKAKLLIYWALFFSVAGGAYVFRADISVALKNIAGFQGNPIDLISEAIIKPVVREETPAPPPLRSLTPVSPSENFLTASGILTETNRHRAENGLSPLSANSRLDLAAKIKTDDMFALEYFAHISPSGAGPSDLAREAGYEYIVIGENLAMGFFERDAGLVQAWMDSPGHRANILNSRYTELGVYVAKGDYEGREVWMAVQEFGRPLSLCPSIDKTLLADIEENNAQIDLLAAELEAKKQDIENHRPKRGSEYNQKVDDYNTLVAQYNALIEETKNMIENYNAQVAAFNACASG